ncbi:MAG TPA: ATP-dependent RecD-like DNA helicase [Myxococcota bacterium]|nr:ATP-dependent RecD-like DNA helicase [Myxococcota bacterium]
MIPAIQDPLRPDGGQNVATLEGVLERITYANEENAWSVVKITVPGKRDPVTVVGNLLGVQPGESLRITGTWVTDKKYGPQFRARSYTTLTPATIMGIRKYLGSGMVKGVGPVMAERLVEHFGLETLDVIDAKPERLVEVDGIGPKRSTKIREAWASQKQIREVMVFLQGHGVSTLLAVKIFKQYGNRAIATVQENPYCLALDIYGIGFKTADKIAGNLGISPTSPRRAEAGVLHVLGEFADDGHVYYPRDRLVASAVEVLQIDAAVIEQAITDLAASEHLVVERLAQHAEAVFLKSLHRAETGAAAMLRERLASAPAPITIDIDRAITWTETQQQLTLAPEQREAIRQAVTRMVLVITGGPGTGKTTLVNSIIQILEKKGRRIVLAAPTGRAAKRMSETTGHEAKTIHRLLEFSPKGMVFERDHHHPLEADIVILDETSMIDSLLAYHVLKAIPPAAQLILVGDVDQLPSVGPGSVLKDIMDSGAVPVVRLSHIFRQAEQSQIVVNAHKINRGEMPAWGAKDEKSDFYFIERNEPEDVLATVKELLAERIPKKLGFNAVDDVQVLTPMHRGLLGSANLNAELQALLNPHGSTLTRGSRTLRVGDKVMQVRNNYDLDVFNGDIGRIEEIDPVEQEVMVSFDGRAVKFEYSDLDELVLAYACSIHKAQGSEYPCVVIPLHTQHYVMLQRNLLYTGVTRARKMVIVVGSKKALAIAVKNAKTAARFTRLSLRVDSIGERYPEPL